MKVLLAESNKEAALSLTTAFRSDGVEVACSSDAIQTLSVAPREKPDVFVLNTQLPGGGGLHLLKRLRSIVHTAVTPVIAICDSEAARQQMLAAGAQEAFVKPVDHNVLVRSIRQHRPDNRSATAAPPADVLADPERLGALSDTGLLDSPPTERFDQLTWLAAKLVSAPTAVLSLVDDHRQFFKAQTGLKGEAASDRQTPLSHSFCQWVVSGREPVAIADAREHSVLQNNLAVRELGVVAYAGVPFSPDGHHIAGSFCAIDSTPRRWTSEQLGTLRDFAAIAEAYTASRVDGSSGPADPTVAVPILAKGIVAGARLLRALHNSLESKGRDIILSALETQGDKLAQLVGAPE